MASEPTPAFYQGEYKGMHYSTLQPHLFRVEYRYYMNRRMYDVDKIISAHSDQHAISRVMRSHPHADIRGDITTTYVKTLEAVYM